MSMVMQAPRMGRKMRSPQHSWNLATKPFALTPFMAAPVLPGETLKNAVFQSRVVTSPINNPLIGWWKEYYFFYCKLTDMVGGDDYKEMLVNEDHPPKGATDRAGFLYGGGGAECNPYVEEALDQVWEHYFRDELVSNWPTITVGAQHAPSVRPHGNSFLDSLHANSLHVSNDEELVVGVDDKITASELEQLMLRYELEKSGGLTKLTYEDWLAKQGVGRGNADVVRKPELIRFVREWTYPANTVNPADGKVSSVCSWAISGRVDKDRFFNEPGIILGVTVSRPKVYLGHLNGPAVNYMTNMRHWLGGIIGEMSDATYQKFAKTAGPVAGMSEDYWIDFRDLFMHGDQWLGHDYDGDINLPNASGLPVVNDAMVATLFPEGSDQMVREDGICSLRIASRVRDPDKTRG